MTEVVATAPGKIILFGEHAVVYGQPAIASPLFAVQARAVVRPGRRLQIIAANLARTIVVHPQPTKNEHALSIAARLLLNRLGVPFPPYEVLLHSTIPVASGLGSGAAATTALLRALARALGHPLDAAELNELVFEIEKLYHGTPSGIDNTVIVYERPVYFVRGRPIETFQIGAPIHLLVADTGIASPTRAAVGDVRVLYERDPQRIGVIFESIGTICRQARQAIERGTISALGPLMQENQALLRELTVSSPELEQLIEVALEAGASGAKLSGGGRGGNMIALVAADAAAEVADALYRAGAARVILTTLKTEE